MKRSNFLATIAAIFLAPFGLKRKSEYTIFKNDPEKIGNWWVTIDEPVKFSSDASFCVNGTEYKLPVPDDNEYHVFAVKHDRGEIEYFIDGERVIS